MDDTTTFTHRRPSSAIESVPELYDLGVGCPPLRLKLLNFLVGELLRLEFPPGAECTHIAEGEIANFPDATLGRFFHKAAVRDTEYLARGDAVRFVARIVRFVEATIALKLPFFAGSPRQRARFDTAEVAADQRVAGGCTDGRAAAFTNDRQRPLVARTHMFVVAGCDCSDGGVEPFVLNGKTFEILWLIPLTSPAPSGCTVIAKGAPNTITIARTRQ